LILALYTSLLDGEMDVKKVKSSRQNNDRTKVDFFLIIPVVGRYYNALFFYYSSNLFAKKLSYLENCWEIILSVCSMLYDHRGEAGGRKKKSP
jgi:hypothetical protein